jgi:multimeric flavodoxin WrbA
MPSVVYVALADLPEGGTMPIEKVTILDGTRPGDKNLEPLLAVLKDQLKSTGAEVQTFTLREIKLAHCIGCFGCWVETPGLCVEADAGREIAKTVSQSQTLILFTPITFGGYSSELKRMVDRLVPLALPHFTLFHGEVHHNPRYPDPPRLVGIGVQHEANSEEQAIFKALVGRNAINFHSSHYAAEVVADSDRPETLRRRFADVLSRSRYAPLAERMTTGLPTPSTSGAYSRDVETGKALLIVGSPKTKSPSTSGVLGGYVLGRLKAHGWETESLTLRAGLRLGPGQDELLSSTDRADLLLLAFPLYVDSLPFLVTKALEVIASHRQALPNRRPQRLVAIVNNGFPEAAQNALALAICRRFADRSGIAWAGGLAMGAGEALSSGQSLTAPAHFGPPVSHVIDALDMAGAALANDQPVPGEAARLIAKSPIPLLHSSVWRWLFVKMGNRHWRVRAAGFGVSRKDLLAQPLA